MLRRIRKILWHGFIVGNCSVILFCLLACLSPFLYAGKYPIIALLGLGFPLLYAANFLLGVYWIFKKSKWLWASVFILLAGLYQFTMIFGLHIFGNFEDTRPTGSLRIATWNLSSWGITKRNNPEKINYRQEMTEVLRKANADIICLQEYNFLKEQTFRDSIIPELKQQGFNYFLFARTRYTMHLYHSVHVTGVAIASRYPLTDTARFEYGADDYAEPLIYGDVQFGGQTIRIITTHLESVRFDAYNYEALHNLKDPVNASVTQFRAVAGKLKRAYKKRSSQAEFLHQKITESPYPVIVCGDFNDVPGSYTYYTAKGNLQDAFLHAGFGFGRTYRFISPTLRIDYILADKKFKVEQYKKIEVNYSDHYPVIADVSIKN